MARVAQRGGERGCGAVDALGDLGQPVRPVVDRVEAGDVRQQHLRRADVAGGLVAADVLLARLERHAERGVAVAVLAHADDAAGDLALELVGRGEEGGVRAAVAHRDAEALAAADATSAPHLPGASSKRQREQVGGDGELGARGVQGIREGGVVHDLAVGRRVLHEGARAVGLWREAGPVAHLDADALRLGALLHDGDGLRVAARVDEEEVAASGAADEHRHGLGGGGALVQEDAFAMGRPVRSATAV